MKPNASRNDLLIVTTIAVVSYVSNNRLCATKWRRVYFRSMKSHTLYIPHETNTLTHFSQGLPIAALAFVAVTPTLLAAQRSFCGRVLEALVVTYLRMCVRKCVCMSSYFDFHTGNAAICHCAVTVSAAAAAAPAGRCCCCHVLSATVIKNARLCHLTPRLASSIVCTPPSSTPLHFTPLTSLQSVWHLVSRFARQSAT